MFTMNCKFYQKMRLPVLKSRRKGSLVSFLFKITSKQRETKNLSLMKPEEFYNPEQYYLCGEKGG